MEDYCIKCENFQWYKLRKIMIQISNCSYFKFIQSSFLNLLKRIRAIRVEFSHMTSHSR